MITEQQQERASLYALGALGPGERKAFEAELRSSAELGELVRSLQSVADLVAMTAPQVALPPNLKAKVLQFAASAPGAPAALPASSSIAGAAAIGAANSLKPQFLFHGAQDSRGWKELPIQGAWLKLLSYEPARGYAVLLGRLEAGVRYPAHTHPGPEELYIITGDLRVGDRSLGPGDFHHADAGTAHGVNYSIEGCTLLAVLPPDHELVQFALESA